MKVLQDIKVKNKLLLLTVPLIACIIAAVVVMAVRINQAEKQVTELYYDTLYQVNNALINADRDFYQTMIAATQYYDLTNGYSDMPSQLLPPYQIQKMKAYEENKPQVMENVNYAIEIAKNDEKLFTAIQADDGLTFEQAVDKFNTGYTKWDEAFDLKGNTGDWNEYNDRFNTARAVLNDMQLITEKWALEEHEVLEKEIATTVRNSAIIFGLLIVLLALLAVAISKSITFSIANVTRQLDKLADGDLGVKFPTDSAIGKDELGGMQRSAKKLSQKLREVIQKAKDMSEHLTDAGVDLADTANQDAQASEQVTESIGGISKGAAEQAESVERAAGNTDDIGNNIENIASNVVELDQYVEEMKAACDTAMNALDVLVHHSGEVSRSVQDIGESITSTNDSVKLISEFTQAITDIASQTNLLSLNASIEAARAGEAGRGFAVVADEIRQLADQSNASAEKIRGIVEKLLANSKASVDVLNKLNESFEVQGTQLESTKSDMESMSVNVSRVKDTSGSISGRISSLTDAKDALTEIVSDLSAISEENAASSQETNASMEELNASFTILNDSAAKLQELAEELSDTISYFKM